MSRFAFGDNLFGQELPRDWWEVHGPSILAKEIDFDEEIRKKQEAFVLPRDLIYQYRGGAASGAEAERNARFVSMLEFMKKILGQTKVPLGRLGPAYLAVQQEITTGRFSDYDLDFFLELASASWQFNPANKTAVDTLRSHDSFAQPFQRQLDQAIYMDPDDEDEKRVAREVAADTVTDSIIVSFLKEEYEKRENQDD